MRVLVSLVATVAVVGACRATAPSFVRFAPAGTDVTRLRSEFALTDAERGALTPDNLKSFTQEQVDQIYVRLTPGPLPDGPFRGDLFFPRDRDGNAHIADLPEPAPKRLSHVATLKAERLGRMLWRGKMFFRSEGVVRNRIEDLGVLRAFVPEASTIPKLTFDGATTFLLFPARLSCGKSRLDPAHPSVVIDYSEGPTIQGYRPVPDRLVGPEGLDIRDEMRLVRSGFYLGRAYFGDRFGLNFTVVDPARAGATSGSAETIEDCTSR
jgi:hypothetical protein